MNEGAKQRRRLLEGSQNNYGKNTITNVRTK